MILKKPLLGRHVIEPSPHGWSIRPAGAEDRCKINLPIMGADGGEVGSIGWKMEECGLVSAGFQIQAGDPQMLGKFQAFLSGSIVELLMQGKMLADVSIRGAEDGETLLFIVHGVDREGIGNPLASKGLNGTIA